MCHKVKSCAALWLTVVERWLMPLLLARKKSWHVQCDISVAVLLVPLHRPVESRHSIIRMSSCGSHDQQEFVSAAGGLRIAWVEAA